MNNHREYNDEYKDEDITIMILLIGVAMVIASIYLVL